MSGEMQVRPVWKTLNGCGGDERSRVTGRGPIGRMTADANATISESVECRAITISLLLRVLGA